MSHRHRSIRSKALEAESRIRGWSDGTEVEVSEIQDLILRATAYATPGLKDLAGEAEVSVDTLSSWRRGTRVPRADAVEVLAAVLRERAELLAHYARRLQEASGLA
jgi:transcriptional regulator with XRE-family HTH domain